MRSGLVRPSEIETLAGVPLGRTIGAKQTRDPNVQLSPADALVKVIAGIVARNHRCYVEFSGGCDSSLVLAATVKACRSSGADDPIPVTFRFPGLPETDETEYQSLMVARLGLRDWVVLDDSTGAFDVLSPSAQESIRTHGVFFPGTFHNRAHVFRDLGPSALLTGEGGDEILGRRRLTDVRDAARAVVRRNRAARAVRQAVLSVSPRWRRVQTIERAVERGWAADWIVDTNIRRKILRTIALEDAQEPLDPRRYMAYYNSLRRMSVTDHNCRTYAQAYDVEWHAPLGDAAFTNALLGAVPRTRYYGRSELLASFFSELLPTELLLRRDKTHFTRAFLGVHTRVFANGWNGSGLPGGASVEWLSHHWRTESEIHGGTILLLQQAWLASTSGGGVS